MNRDSVHAPHPRAGRQAGRLHAATLGLLGGLGLWGALCLGPGAGGLAAAEPMAPAAVAATAPDGVEAARPEVLAQTFGAPCEGEAVPPPPIALRPPLDALYVRYLQARCQAAAGRLEEAAQGFRVGLEEPLAVPTLWRWQLLRTRVVAGDHDAALKELEALLTADPDPLLRRRARELVASLVMVPGKVPLQRQDEFLVTYLERGTPGWEDHDLIRRLWERAGEQNNESERRALARLLWRNPKDEASAARWAAPPAEPEGADGAPATGADYYGRAERLFSLGLFERLADELERPALPAWEPAYAKALGRLYFRALMRANRLQHAAVQVNTGSVMRRFDFDRRQQLVWAIRIQLKRRMIGPVLKYLGELEQLAPQDESLPGIFLELLKYNHGRRDEVTAGHWLKRLATAFGSSPEASDAYWLVIWDAIERREYARALPLLEQAIAVSAPFHPVDRARLHYWRGRLQMRQGDQAAAEATWRELEQRYPYGYYTSLAEWMRQSREIVLVGGRHDSVPDPGPAPLVEALWAIEPFPAALFLFSVGEMDLGQSLLRDAVARKLPDDALEEAGALFYYLERHYLQLRLMANHLLSDLRQSRVERTVLWQRAFPRPHWDVVQRLAEEQHIDPYFVLAIMREESRFYSSANSTAGARGLMQLMPSTARMVAKHNGLDYDEELLHTPEFNIPIGTMYLKRVLERFDGNPVFAAAAYNAGPTNARRWVNRYGELPLDEFVERIPFGETQRYVKRVFLSYLVYTQLYR
jgi:soluble lytic murein transglycosylase